MQHLDVHVTKTNNIEKPSPLDTVPQLPGHRALHKTAKAHNLTKQGVRKKREVHLGRGVAGDHL